MTELPLRLCTVPNQGLVFFTGPREGRILQPIEDQLRTGLAQLLLTATDATLAVPASTVVSGRLKLDADHELVLSRLAAGVSRLLGQSAEFEQIDPQSSGFLKLSVVDTPAFIGHRLLVRLTDVRSRQTWREVLKDMTWAKVNPGAAFDAFLGGGGLTVSDATDRFTDADVLGLVQRLASRVQTVVDQHETFPSAVVVPLLNSERLRYAA